MLLFGDCPTVSQAFANSKVMRSCFPATFSKFASISIATQPIPLKVRIIATVDNAMKTLAFGGKRFEQ